MGLEEHKVITRCRKAASTPAGLGYFHQSRSFFGYKRVIPSRLRTTGLRDGDRPLILIL